MDVASRLFFVVTFRYRSLTAFDFFRAVVAAPPRAGTASRSRTVTSVAGRAKIARLLGRPGHAYNGVFARRRRMAGAQRPPIVAANTDLNGRCVEEASRRGDQNLRSSIR
ncbi:hypothetical protein Pan14r_35050 [Crateriforma conspicua]|uniref:Uncharacterized protein n=1 Tax=Crateriforma conspicua TaxID=2527996 RepID=A0A5C5YA49_9PLAN|nr:hypothetical protein Pan14r_35050 [Crateriforma conspicua]